MQPPNSQSLVATFIGVLALSLALGGTGCDPATSASGLADATGDAQGEPPCAIEARVAAKAGSGALDCGVVADTSAPDTAYACMVKAHKSGEPFSVVFLQQGMDSKLALGFARDAAGALWLFNYDSCAMGCGDGHPAIVQGRCVGAIVMQVAGDEALGCASIAEVARTCGPFDLDLPYAVDPKRPTAPIVLRAKTSAGVYPAKLP